MNQLKTISFEEAKKLAEVTIEVAREKGVEIAITVIDITGRRLVSFTMDGAIPITPELSERKARLALKMHLDTIELQKQGVNVMDFGPGYSAFGGGMVITNAMFYVVYKKTVDVFGAIGVSGLDTGEKDHDLAMEGWERYRDKYIFKKEV